MSEYMIFMNDNDDESPYHIKDVVSLVRYHDECKTFESVDGAINACVPIVKLYGMGWCKSNRDIANKLAKYNVGSDVVVATGKNRYLHIIKVEDQYQSRARFLAGKA